LLKVKRKETVNRLFLSFYLAATTAFCMPCLKAQLQQKAFRNFVDINNEKHFAMLFIVVPGK